MLFTKKSTKAVGDYAESLAEDFLKAHKVKILEKNFSCRSGEIDLIVKDKDTLVFVEVRYRKSTNFGQPFETVTKTKQNKIIRSAQTYLQKHPKAANKACRFDVISIQQGEIDWIKNAFDTDS